MDETSRLQCPSDNDYYNQQREKRTSSHVFENSVDNLDRWHTSTHDAFCKLEEGESRSIGRRKELTRKTVGERVLLTIANEMNPQEVVDDGVKPSEYFDNFCDPEFTPFMDQPLPLADNFVKYPLYLCNNQTLYKELIERGGLKSRSEISDLNTPFRRNCTFTTAPDQALREPTGGF